MFCFSISTNEFFKLIFDKTFIYLANFSQRTIKYKKPFWTFARYMSSYPICNKLAVEILDDRVGICSTLKETSKLFTKVVLSFYIPMNSYENSNCFMSLLTITVSLLSFSHFSDYETVYVIRFQFAFL